MILKFDFYRSDTTKFCLFFFNERALDIIYYAQYISMERIPPPSDIYTLYEYCIKITEKLSIIIAPQVQKLILYAWSFGNFNYCVFPIDQTINEIVFLFNTKN